jgi:hypothetical protein
VEQQCVEGLHRPARGDVSGCGSRSRALLPPKFLTSFYICTIIELRDSSQQVLRLADMLSAIRTELRLLLKAQPEGLVVNEIQLEQDRDPRCRTISTGRATKN